MTTLTAGAPVWLVGAAWAGERENFRETTSCAACDLAGADLTGVDLLGATLHGTDLRGARFDGARLTNAILSDTQRDGASFEDAIILSGRGKE